MTNKGEKGDVEFIGFKTTGEWSVAELQTFASSVTKIYNVFFALNFKERIEDKQRAFFEEQFHKNLDHPVCEVDPFMLWRDLLKQYMKRKIPYLPPLPFWFPFPPELKETFPRVTATEIFQNFEQYSSDEQWLKIYRIRMGSPGGFSFTGIGEILKEIREFIKDIWYRNKQEKILGQMDIIDKYICMRKKYSVPNYLPLPPVPSEKELAKILNEQVNKIRELESKGKLKDVAENVNYLPE
jgi:hypothetical protein